MSDHHKAIRAAFERARRDLLEPTQASAPTCHPDGTLTEDTNPTNDAARVAEQRHRRAQRRQRRTTRRTPDTDRQLTAAMLAELVDHYAGE